MQAVPECARVLNAQEQAWDTRTPSTPDSAQSIAYLAVFVLMMSPGSSRKEKNMRALIVLL